MVKGILYGLANIVLWQLRTVGDKPAITAEEYRKKKLLWLRSRARSGHMTPQDLANIVYMTSLRGGQLYERHNS